MTDFINQSFEARWLSPLTVEIEGTAAISSATGKITAITGKGVMSGSTGAAGVHTIYLGHPGNASAQNYRELVSFTSRGVYPASGSTFTALPLAVFQSEAVVTAGTVTFALYNPSGSAEAGTITHTVGTPSANVTVPFSIKVRELPNSSSYGG